MRFTSNYKFMSIEFEFRHLNYNFLTFANIFN